MCYAIVNGIGQNKFYLTGIEKGYCMDWDYDAQGKVIRKVERVPVREKGREKGLQIVGKYMKDPGRAMRFQSRETAEKKIQEYPVLRFCRVEEVEW